jgi:3'(2'), 5'-bisphosphate nucleotidase
LNELYFAEENSGSFKVLTSPNSNVQDLITSAEKLPLAEKHTSFRVVASRSHMSPETEEFIRSLENAHGTVETISRGSSLKLCMVAEGKADCYPRFAPTMEWDTAAGQSICLYSGAQVIDWKSGTPMLYNRENLLNEWFLVKR